MSPDEQVATALALRNDVTLRDLQIALEWQRESGASVLDILIYVGATTQEAVETAAAEMEERPDLHLGGSVPARDDASERRKFRRVEIPEGFAVEVGATQVGGSQELLNLSMGGLGYSTRSAPSSGEHIPVKIRSTRGNVLQTRGRVKYLRESAGRWTVGLEFDELSAGTLYVLDSIVKELRASN